MNTDVIFLTTMIDILTGPIPAPFADEFWRGGNQDAGYIFFILDLDWVSVSIHVYPCELMWDLVQGDMLVSGQRVNKHSEKQ